MKVPKIKSTSGFGLGNILGLIFVLIGILLALILMGYDLPIDTRDTTIFQWGAVTGSILGGLAMLFKKKETVPM
tara:strand:- start:708 stop:929 length:222 start_codon:yes stop_codon:yes gene_type:complete